MRPGRGRAIGRGCGAPLNQDEEADSGGDGGEQTDWNEGSIGTPVSAGAEEATAAELGPKA